MRLRHLEHFSRCSRGHNFIRRRATGVFQADQVGVETLETLHEEDLARSLIRVHGGEKGPP